MPQAGADEDYDDQLTAPGPDVEALARAVGLGPRTPGGRIVEIGISGHDGVETVIRAEDTDTEHP